MKKPILFIVFNRPSTTRKVFELIRKYAPTELYIAADGPRVNVPSDIANIQLVRNIFKDIDWNCKVHTFFREENQGCKVNVSSAITWFFDNVEDGIILEDDCIVDESFFSFCEENLDRYENEFRVMHISASNFQKDIVTNDSYYFSKYNHIWGWASWKRAWKNYEVNLNSFNRNQLVNKLSILFPRKADRTYWLAIYDYLKSGNLDTWDYSWMFCMWMHDGVGLTPSLNLVSNIGFGKESTHTADPNFKYANMAIHKLDFPQKHPKQIEINEDADLTTSDHLFNISTSYKSSHLKIKISSLLPIKMKKLLKKWWF